jgi:hypothetical protein
VPAYVTWAAPAAAGRDRGPARGVGAAQSATCVGQSWRRGGAGGVAALAAWRLGGLEQGCALVTGRSVLH